MNPVSLPLSPSYDPSGTAAAVLTITDADYKSEKYTVTVDGKLLGTTSDFSGDSKKYCDTKKADQCISVSLFDSLRLRG